MKSSTNNKPCNNAEIYYSFLCSFQWDNWSTPVHCDLTLVRTVETCPHLELYIYHPLGDACESWLHAQTNSSTQQISQIQWARRNAGVYVCEWKQMKSCQSFNTNVSQEHVCISTNIQRSSHLMLQTTGTLPRFSQSSPYPNLHQQTGIRCFPSS